MIGPKGEVQTIAGSDEGFGDGPALQARFNTPSGIAIDRDGNLFIADTSNNRIRKLSADRTTVSTVAGSGAAGYRDGPAGDAEFDGPIGVAVDRSGNVYVADTYNDRIRRVSPEGEVTTVAGSGSPGSVDGEPAAAMFDTPCGIAVDGVGELFVADTGNRSIRKIAPTGEVTTIRPGMPPSATGSADWLEPHRFVSLAVTHDGFIFATGADTGHVYRITPEGDFSTYAGIGHGAVDTIGGQPRMIEPAGIAIDREGNLYIADSRVYVIRKVPPVAIAQEHGDAVTGSEPFIQPPQGAMPEAEAVYHDLDASTLNITAPFVWPVGPQDRWHEVAGVAGEARGNFNGTALDHLHAGLDVRGVMGDPCLSIYDEKVSLPIANWGFGDTGEGISVGAFSYIHIRVGRDGKGIINAPKTFKARLDATGKLVGVRVRRGTRFRRGDFLGTLNQLYHVHLNLGPWSAIANPITLPFAEFKDTVAPVIEPNGIELIRAVGDRQGTPENQPITETRGGRLLASGDVQIVVTAYDRVDGNVASRKLGLYRLGYQLLRDDGSPVAGYEQPLMNLIFNRLPPEAAAVTVAYAPGSGISAYGTPTRFRYLVTNRVRDGIAREGFLRLSNLTPGNYVIRVIAEDYAGNRASGKGTELAIAVQ